MTRLLVSVSLATIVLYGCSAAPDSGSLGSGASSAPLGREDTSQSVVTTVVDARPAALINSQSIGWGDLRPQLSELAGAAALEDVILDQRLKQLTADRGIEVTAADEALEQSRLLQTLSPDPDTAVRLLAELRQTQGLGPVRYSALLRRNALLRRLVDDRVNVDQSELDQMFDIRYGPRRRVRLITVNTLADAEVVSAQVRAGSRFADVAVTSSTDISAARGGMLEPIAERDPTYPAALRQAIWSLASPGAMSPPILLENGYGIVELVEEVPSAGVDRSEVAVEIENLVRLRRERIRMDKLAQRVLRDARVTIFDESLEYSWRAR